MDLEEFERGVRGGEEPSSPVNDALLKQLDAAVPTKDPGLRALEEKTPPPPAADRATPSVRRSRPQDSNRQARGRRRRR
jgi:hypothetical protein